MFIIFHVTTERFRGPRRRSKIFGARNTHQQQQYHVRCRHIQPRHDHTRAGHRSGFAARRRSVASAAQSANTERNCGLAQQRPHAHHYANDRAGSFEASDGRSTARHANDQTDDGQAKAQLFCDETANESTRNCVPFQDVRANVVVFRAEAVQACWQHFRH